MKKNRMMRVASGLLVAVLLTTCVISGTFAKYITADDANDSARVAKFGVVVTAEGSLFEKSYLHAPETGENATVVASEEVDVVAPGTNNADNAFKFSITGKPEVDVKVEVVVTDAGEDVFLKAGTYEDLTTGDATDEYVLGADYYPVKYTLKHKGVAVTGAENVTLAQLETALEAISVAKVDANTDLATEFGEYEISWAWDFDDNGVGTNDEADTILGDLAAGSPAAGLDGAALEDGTHYNLNTGLKVAITVTQID